MGATAGVQLEIARIRVGLKQHELAARVGITQTKLSEIVSGRLQPKPQFLQRLPSILEERQGGKKG